MAHLRLQSARLLLVAASSAILEAEKSDRTLLARRLGAEIPLTWPPALYDHEVIDLTLSRLREDAANFGWLVWYVLARRPGDQPLAIGTAGFRGAPDGDGVVQLGFGTVSSHRGRGYATEAARALMEWAFDHPEVRAIRVETLPDGTDTIRVLKKLGFAPEEESPYPGVVGFRLTRRV